MAATIKVIGMGLFDGEASVAFTYWIMYKLTAEESYIVYAKKQCQFILVMIIR